MPRSMCNVYRGLRWVLKAMTKCSSSQGSSLPDAPSKMTVLSSKPCHGTGMKSHQSDSQQVGTEQPPQCHSALDVHRNQSWYFTKTHTSGTHPYDSHSVDLECGPGPVFFKTPRGILMSTQDQEQLIIV